jgi:hypothetical protein
MSTALPELPKRLKETKIRHLWEMTAEEVMYLIDRHTDFDPDPQRLVDPKTKVPLETEAEFRRRVEHSFKFSSLRKIVLRDMFGQFLFKNPNLVAREGPLPPRNPGDPESPMDLLDPRNRLRTPVSGEPPRPPFLHYSPARRATVLREIHEEFNEGKTFANITNRSAFLSLFHEKVTRVYAKNPNSVPPAVVESARNCHANHKEAQSTALADLTKALKDEEKPTVEQLAKLLARMAIAGTDDPRFDQQVAYLLDAANRKIEEKSELQSAHRIDVPRP